MNVHPRAHALTRVPVQVADDRTPNARVGDAARGRDPLPIDGGGGGDSAPAGSISPIPRTSSGVPPPAVRCRWCGDALPDPALTGRSRGYCSPRCRKAAHRHRRQGLPVAQAPTAPPGCQARDCGAPAAAVTSGGRCYCGDHARLVRDVWHRRTAPLIRCVRCGCWAARDLELRRGDQARPLCAGCAELIDELVEVLGEGARP